jgi:hypothetical protein
MLWVSTVFFNTVSVSRYSRNAILTRKFTYKSEIFSHKTSHMVLSIIFLEEKDNMWLHLSIFYEYQQFFQHRICFSIQPPDYSDPWSTLPRSSSFFLIMLFNYHDLSIHYIVSDYHLCWGRTPCPKCLNKKGVWAKG